MTTVRALVITVLGLAACGNDEVLPDAAVRDDGPAPADAGPDARVDARPDASTVMVTGLDPAFGTDGWVAFDGTIGGLAERPDRGLVVCGGDQNGPLRVVRLRADGAQEATFGVGGVVALPGYASCTAVGVLADGRIVIAANPAPHFVVLSPDGAVQAAAPGYLAADWSTSILPLADGGFAFAGVYRRMAGADVTYTTIVGRHDAALNPVTAFANGSIAIGLARPETPRPRLARVVAGGVERYVVGTYGRTAGVRASDGVVDGSFETTPPGAYGSITVAATGAQVTAAYPYLPTPPDRVNTRAYALAANGLEGPATRLDYCDSDTADETAAAIALDSAGRTVVVPVGGGRWPDVRLTRLAPGGVGLDPAWGCGRTLMLPAFCPPGTPCPGTYADNADVTAVDALVTTGDAIIVAGNQHRFYIPGLIDETRGFIARVLP